MPARLSDVLADLGIDDPTPIQAATLPDSLAGRDVLGRGRTGSGKTYAFLIPLVARLGSGGAARPRAPRALVLAPTRELAGQIEASLAPLARANGLSYLTVFGGVGQGPQVNALRRGVHILIACPGRLEDLITQGHCNLTTVEIAVLDEADHMADIGFLPAVRRLLTQTPRNGQRLLFSATLDNAIDTLVRQFLTNPVTHEADSTQSPVATMTHHVLHIEREHRLAILLDLTSAPGRTVVFTRTKHGAKALTRQLNNGGVPAIELHGNLSQNARGRNLDAFHTGTATVLVATDIAARGIHIDDVTMVIHADPPAEHKAYLHRSGRTARAGNTGTVVTLMTSEQARDVRDLTRAAGISPATTRINGTAHPILAELAPGPRSRSGPMQHRESAVATGSPSVRRPAKIRRPRGQGSGSGSTHNLAAPGRSNPSAKRSSMPAASGRTSDENQVARPGRKRGSSTQAPGNQPPRRHSAAAFSSGSRRIRRGA